jgi:outer membrane protein OmpA-like peptidoglycan-associated protein
MRVAIFRARHSRGGALIAALCIFLVHATYAAEQLMDEQNIDEQSVINALAPENSGGTVMTQGITHRPSDPGNEPTEPAKKAAAELLITFASNSSTLTSRARAALDQVAHALESAQLSEYKFRIEGHADSRGSAAANMKLSADRAVAVLEYLSRADGVAPERLFAVGKGSSEPLDTQNPTAPENRRVTIIRLPY